VRCHPSVLSSRQSAFRDEGSASKALRSESRHHAGIQPHASTVILSAAKDLLFTSPKPQSIAKKTRTTSASRQGTASAAA